MSNSSQAPAARDDLGGEDVAVGGLVDRLVEVDPGGAHQLAHHHPLGAVDDEGPVGGHHREVAQEDLLLLDLPGGAVHEARRDEQGARVVGVALLGLVDGQGGLIETVVGELEGEGPGEVLDGRDFLEDLTQAPLQEPAERVVLDGQEVGEREDFGDLRERETVGARTSQGILLSVRSGRTG